MTGRPHALTEAERAEVRRRWRAGETQLALAQQYGVCVRTIGKIVRGCHRPGDPGRAVMKDAALCEASEHMRSALARAKRALTRDDVLEAMAVLRFETGRVMARAKEWQKTLEGEG